MKKILLTGSEGFVGKHLVDFFSQKDGFTLHAPKLQEWNLTSSDDVSDYLRATQPDIIIHSATSNTQGKGYADDVCEQNLRMFFNLLRYRKEGCVIYTLCSGSSYAREHWVEDMSEDYLGEHIPSDGQGFSKYVIASHARHLKNVVTLRLFGIFGEHEDHRYKFISNTIAKGVAGIDVLLFKDAKYHYLDVADFCTILADLIGHGIHSGEFNVVPDEAVTIKEIIDMVNRNTGIEKPFEVATPGTGRPYTGSNQRLHGALRNLSFTPMAASIQRLAKHYLAHPHLIDRSALLNDQLLQHAKEINKS